MRDAYPEAIHVLDGGWTHESRDVDSEGWTILSSVATEALRGEARIALLRTGIALERHRLKHGDHPASLTELVPSFLPALLEDPFTRQPPPS